WDFPWGIAPVWRWLCGMTCRCSQPTGPGRGLTWASTSALCVDTARRRAPNERMSSPNPAHKETASGASIDPDDVARFSAQAAEWWDAAGPFAPLHQFNPARLAFVRDRAAERFDRDVRTRRPFQGLNLLDVGCGGGLIAEPMSRLGFSVTAIDASAENIGTARAHAAPQG